MRGIEGNKEFNATLPEDDRVDIGRSPIPDGRKTHRLAPALMKASGRQAIAVPSPEGHHHSPQHTMTNRLPQQRNEEAYRHYFLTSIDDKKIYSFIISTDSGIHYIPIRQ